MTSPSETLAKVDSEGYDLPANATHHALQAGKYTKENLLPDKLKDKKYYED